jgi:hypothetical protein
MYYGTLLETLSIIHFSLTESDPDFNLYRRPRTVSNIILQAMVV